LRQNPHERWALRFDVNWKAERVHRSNLKLRLELRTSKGDFGKPVVIDAAVKAPLLFGRWSSLTLPREAYEGIGEIIAWRVSLWDGELMLAEEKSFLW
jgi:hypothetical protein